MRFSRVARLVPTLVLAAGLSLGCSDDRDRAPVPAKAAPSTLTSTRLDSTVRTSVPATVVAPPRAVTAAPSASTKRASTAPAARVASSKPAVVGPRRVVIAGVDLTGIGYDRGDPRAPVVVVDLSDFACPYCGEFSRETYPVIEREYVRTGKVLFKYVPFVAGNFPHSREATRAAECSADAGKFWEMFDRLYATQAEWRKGNAADAQMAALAANIPIDSARFADCYRDRRTDVRTARATDLANQLGVRVTPSFLVNDRPIQGALSAPEFRTVIDAALMVAPSSTSRTSMQSVVAFLSRSWPWYVSGPLIGLMVPALLLVGNKAFGISSNLRHLCAAAVPGRVAFFQYDWRRAGAWNLAFAAGILVGGFIAGHLLAGDGVSHISAAARTSLGALGVHDFTGLVPRELFSWSALRTVPGVIMMVGGGLLVGFGTAYAGGCTSGHAISGLAHFQLPSLVAVCGFFAGGLIGTWLLLPRLL